MFDKSEGQRWGRMGVVFGAWALLGGVAVGNSLLSHSAAACDAGAGPIQALPDLAVISLPPYLFWALATPLILLLAERRPLERLREPLVVAQHLAALAVAVGASVVFKTWAHNVLRHTEAFGDGLWHFDAARLRDTLHAGLLLDVFTYGAILAVGAAWSYYRASRQRETETAQLEARLADARFETLRAKVEPHFLFNTLNTISALAESDPAATRETVASLSTLLRRALDHGSSNEVALEEELSFSQHYLEIERRRYGSRLHVEFAIARDARALLVPSFLLQPLLENSIRHGISRKRGPSVIRVEARRDNGQLLVRVRDDGAGSRGELVEGIGLASTRARLQELYGAAAELVAAGSDAGFEVMARLPVREPSNGGDPAAAPTAAPAIDGRHGAPAEA